MFRFTRPATVPVPPSPDAGRHAALVDAFTARSAQLAADLQAVGLDVLKVRHAALQRELSDLVAQSISLQQREHAIRFTFDREWAALEQALIDASDPRIAVFIAECERELDALPKQLRTFEVRGPVSAKTGLRAIGSSNNGEAIGLVQEALLRAKAAAEQLRLETVPDVGAALDQIRASVPSVEAAEAALAAAGERSAS
ncbi:MAG: hypothetical protein AB7Q29_19700 [Vicinamibacterales bacterium]